MKSLKVKKTGFNNRKHSLIIQTAKGTLTLPYSKLGLKPSSENPITDVYPDKELGSLAVTYKLKDGREDSILVDAFLDYNRDPNYIREMELHRLTIDALHAFQKSGLSKREICRRLGTSMSQLLRLLDPANTKKTFDQMFKLLIILGSKVDIKVA